MLDYASPRLRAIFGFTGITDVELIRVNGVNRGADGAEITIAAAPAQIAAKAT